MSLIEPTNPLLNKAIQPVAQNEINAPHTRFIIDRMLQLAAGAGKTKADTRQMVGLAAPQIGVDRQIVIVDTTATGANQKQRHQVFINPRITWQSAKKVLGREGCWSCGNICGAVERAESVKVQALDASGKQIALKLDGFPARIAQHEIDHLSGIRFPDRITDDKKLHWVAPHEFERYRAQWQTWPHLCPRARWLELKAGNRINQ
jgi:peptide deformylase